MRLSDTIVAISTPPGRGGIGVVRLSGPLSRHISDTLLTFPAAGEWQARSVRNARLIDEAGGTVDHVLAVFFEGPRSYTGEDVVEISCHGSPVVLRFCVERAMKSGARPAEPGEFTLRAFLNGRIDLPRAEAIRDLIESTTLYQAKVAAQQAEGSVSRRLAPLKEQMLELIALLEAGIDFAEDDIDVASSEEILRRLGLIESDLERLARSFAYGKLVHSGFTLAIVGRPNVGKSSLFNRLLEQERAIVTDIPGTTRDTVSEAAAIGGLPVRLLDTAGIREGVELVERLGIERSYQAMADADLTVVVLDASAAFTADDAALIKRARQSGRSVEDAVQTIDSTRTTDGVFIALGGAKRHGNSIVVANKIDVPDAVLPEAASLAVSAITGTGIDELRGRIVEAVAPEGGVEHEAGFITSLRHEQLLRESLEAIENAGRAVRNQIPHEMLLLDLYAALGPVDAITGATTADDILNRIFTTFCIGK